MEDEAITLAKAESLKETCQFCSEVFQNKDELQLHQVSDCEPIEAANKLSCGQTNNGTTANETLQNEQIHLRETPSEMISSDLHFHQQEGTTTTTHNLPTGNQIQGAVRNNYVLDKHLALIKKRNTYDKPPYSVKERTNCIIVEFNTASFDYFKDKFMNYLENRTDVYSFSPTPQIDQMNNITQDIIRVSDRNTLAPMYTINMYRTRSNAMVNGPMQSHFLHKDFPIITSEIDHVKPVLINANLEIKSQLLRCTNIKRPAHNNSKQKEKKRTKYSLSPSKLHSSRRRSSRIDSTATRRALTRSNDNLDSIQEIEDKPQQRTTEALASQELSDISNDSITLSDLEDTESSETEEHEMSPETHTKETPPVNTAPATFEKPVNPKTSEGEGENPSTTQDPININTSTDNNPEVVRPRRTIQVPTRFKDVEDSANKVKVTEEKGKLYCICKSTWQDDVQYIGCDYCDDWFHHTCVGIPAEAKGIELYRCPECRSKGDKLKKSDKELLQKDCKQLKKDLEEMEMKYQNEKNTNEKRKAEIKSINDSLEQEKLAKDKMATEMEKKQKNLDCLSNQHTKTKKELL